MGNPYKDGNWPLPSTGPSADHVKQLSKRVEALGRDIQILNQKIQLGEPRLTKLETLLGEKTMGAFVGPDLGLLKRLDELEGHFGEAQNNINYLLAKHVGLAEAQPAISAEDLERVKELVETGRSYFINPKGAVYYEADDALEAALKLLNIEGAD